MPLAACVILRGMETFFWHDYETFGRVPRRDRPAQFAGVRTDLQLNEVEAPLVLYNRPAPDSLPEPEACLLTGIVPQTCERLGVSEAEFADAIERQLARPGTVGVGYNSIRFDDEVTRFLFWRCLIDPYAREWQNQCGRWDLLDTVRSAWALRPDGIEWPRKDDARVSFKLADLSRANGLVHDSAHDALSDVRATLALARLVRARQPRLWDFCLRLRKKDAVLAEIEGAQAQGRPFLHVSGMYASERGCLALVWPLAPHPTNRNELIVWDLAHDPSEMQGLNIDSARRRLFGKAADLPEGVTRLPVKTIHLNRSPVVIANLKTLPPPMAQRWGIDLDQGLRHADIAARHAAALAGIWPAVFERAAPAQGVDVDEDLYGGFLNNDDRRTLQRLRGMSGETLAGKHWDFADARLDELLLRYRARNHPQTLSAAQREQWRAHCAERLGGGAPGYLNLRQFGERIDTLQVGADASALAILNALREHAAGLQAAMLR